MRQNLLVVFLLAAYTSASQLCPPECSCNPETMDCITAHLTQPPVGLWSDVQSLDLTNNNITTLYSFSFTGFPNTTFLYLSSNYITALDFEPFAALPKLTYLSLWGNGLTTIVQPPPEVQLVAINELDLSNNKISSLDPDLLVAVAPNLQTFFFTDNPLFILNNGPVLNHPVVQHGSFLRTSLSGLSAQTFQGLPNLRTLILTDSGARNLTGAFANNSLLIFLDLGSCSVAEVPAGTFAAGRKLGYLSLDANPLAALDLQAVELSVRSGGYLQISDTPLACACGYENIYHWAKNASVEVSASCKWQATCPFVDR